MAVEVRIWLDPAGAAATRSPTTTPVTTDHMYLQTVDLPLAQSTGSTTASTESKDGQGGDDGTGFGAGAQFPQ